MTVHAQWLDTTFAGFDKAILDMYHGLAETAGVVVGAVQQCPVC